MNRLKQINIYGPPCLITGDAAQNKNSAITKSLMTRARLCYSKALAIGMVAALMLGSGGFTSCPAQAAGIPPLTLTLTGPQNGAVNQPLEGINIQLINPGQSKPDSRLRLFVHDGLDRDIGPEDIKIEVHEGNAWNAVQVEPIDGGVLGAIGEAGPPHIEIHGKGGFPIAANVNKKWQLRITFRLPGTYTLVTAVSPDNGSTHLAQPVNLSMEAL